MKLLVDSNDLPSKNPWSTPRPQGLLLAVCCAFSCLASPYLKSEPESATALARQAALADLIAAKGSIRPAWQQASGSSQGLEDLLNAVPLIENPVLRENLYPLVKPLLDGLPKELAVEAKSGPPESDGTSSITRAAIRALAFIPGHDAETFTALARLVESAKEPAAALAVLRALPRASWDQTKVGSLVEAVIAYGKIVPPVVRNSYDFEQTVQFGRELVALLPTAEAKAIRENLDLLLTQVVVIRPVPYKMKYDVESFKVAAGKPVEVVFENVNILPHNLLIAAPGSLKAVGNAAEKMATKPDAFAKHFIPELPEVLHATKMLNARQSERLRFTAPTTPGDYPFVCTFPGHWRTMNGIMTVE